MDASTVEFGWTGLVSSCSHATSSRPCTPKERYWSAIPHSGEKGWGRSGSSIQIADRFLRSGQGRSETSSTQYHKQGRQTCRQTPGRRPGGLTLQQSMLTCIPVWSGSSAASHARRSPREAERTLPRQSSEPGSQALTRDRLATLLQTVGITADAEMVETVLQGIRRSADGGRESQSLEPEAGICRLGSLVVLLCLVTFAVLKCAP